MTRSLTRAPSFYTLDLPVPVRAVDGADAISPPDDPLVESAAPTGVGECRQCAYSAEVHRLVWGPR